MFAPAESLPFGVDLSLNARYLPNELALRIARRRDAGRRPDPRAEADGEQGVSDLGYERTQEARDLLAYLQSASRPPLLRATLAVAVGAAARRSSSERVETCRRAYGEIRLHRPLGDQLRAVPPASPGQRTRVAGYDDTLTTEQVAAMMPTATHAVGSRRGFLARPHAERLAPAGALQPARGLRSNRNTAILASARSARARRRSTRNWSTRAFLLGARVIDCDPKGDHRFHLLEEVAPHVETIALRASARCAACSTRCGSRPSTCVRTPPSRSCAICCPARAEAAWETAVVGAVDVVTPPLEPTCRR